MAALTGFQQHMMCFLGSNRERGRVEGGGGGAAAVSSSTFNDQPGTEIFTLIFPKTLHDRRWAAKRMSGGRVENRKWWR